KKLVRTTAGLDRRPSEDLVSSICRSADRWCLLAGVTSANCVEVATLLTTLGAEEAALEYLTTTFVQKSSEPHSWLQLARQLIHEGNATLAERAYAEACREETARAEILWDRVVNLQQLGRTEEARQHLRRIAEGSWAPQYQGIVDQAQRLLASQN